MKSLRIYIAHATAFNFMEEFYAPLSSALNAEHQLIFPHSESAEPFASRKLFETNGCDLILAEVSYPSTGLGIELGWASIKNIPIICLHQENKKASSALQAVTKNLYAYKDLEDLKVVAKNSLLALKFA